MSMKLCLFACAAVLAAVFLSACEQSVGRLEEPPPFLKVESPAVPAPEGVVPPPEKKTAICPDCAARSKGVRVSRAAVYRSGEIPELSDIYFDYDRHVITPTAARILHRNAEWFRANPGVRVRLEGTATRGAPANTTSASGCRGQRPRRAIS